MTTVIVFSHLRWDHVYQRPQHIMTRLGKHFKVLFIEEPVYADGAPRIESQTAAANVEVLRPFTPIDACGFHDDQLTVLKPLLAEYLGSSAIDDYVVWFYTPQALPLISQLHPRAVIYDCMDDLSGFKGAPRQMTQRERALFKIADIVFTGGPSLYDLKRKLHHNVHCLPSAVEASHFSPETLDFDCERARSAQTIMESISHPRLGYCGVIDERMDFDLLQALADGKPDWQFLMVGPVVKVSRENLPKAHNIHWLGMQDYDSLPFLMAGWDACLMPFAINESTRFISPTKTLEYLAAEKPVISTAIADVIGLYGDVVMIAHSVDEFMAHCEAAISMSAAAREAHVAQALGVALRFSWDNSVEVIRKFIVDELEKASNLGSALRELGGLVQDQIADDLSTLNCTSDDRALKRVRNLVVGAGPVGLSAAYHLDTQGFGADTLLIEREPIVGGKYRSVERDGFTFEFAAPTWSTKDPAVLALYDALLHDNQQTLDSSPWFYAHNTYIRYPFTGPLHGLPSWVVKECLVGALEARLDASNNISAEDPQDDAPANYVRFSRLAWGSGIANHFMIPYAEKRWTIAATQIRAPSSPYRRGGIDMEESMSSALDVSLPHHAENAILKFPAHGGMRALMDGFLPLLHCEVALKTTLLHLSPIARTVRLDDGRTFRFDTLISTLPLPVLIQACGMEAPEEIRVAAAALHYVSVRCVNFGVTRKSSSEVEGKHWIHFPGPTAVFHRVFIPGNVNPDANQPGRTAFTCEVAYSTYKPLPCDDNALVERVLEDCRDAGILGPDDQVEVVNQVDIPYAYPIPDDQCVMNMATIRKWLAQFGIVVANQHGEWDPDAADPPFLAGKRAAEEAAEVLRSRLLERTSITTGAANKAAVPDHSIAS